jgi:5-methylcytosine-specific restriction endonuclease McrA
MTIFYLDYENGNDSNDGSTWALDGKVCETCGKKYYIGVREGKKRFLGRKYCSLKCRRIWNKDLTGVCKANSGSFKTGNVPWNEGKPPSESTKIKISINKKGKSNGARSIEVRRKISESQRGEKSHLWRGGVTKQNKMVRESLEYRIWRETVFKRDNWTCQECGIKGGELHQHHIMEFAKYPELRFALTNGLTLCDDCHKRTPSYGVN